MTERRALKVRKVGLRRRGFAQVPIFHVGDYSNHLNVRWVSGILITNQVQAGYPRLSAEVTRTFNLFAGIVADAKSRKGLENREIYHARANIADAPTDPHYTIRAWRGVLTYLLRRPEFLYE